LKKFVSRLNGEIFDTEDEILLHLIDSGIEADFAYYYDIMEEEFFSEDEENRIPDEASAVEEDALKERIVTEKVVDSYLNGELSDTQEKMVLSTMLGRSTGKVHDKVFPENIKLSQIPREYLKQFSEKINQGQCPVSGCGIHYTQLGQNFSAEAEEELKEGIILSHIEQKHPQIWEMLKDLFPTPKKSSVGVQHVKVSNPESCSKYSKEELTEFLKSNEEARKQLYRRWIKSLQK
jgi:hypothetical protein